MLAVVLCHSLAYFGGDWFTVCPVKDENYLLGQIASWLGTFCVSGFTLVSGYIYYFLRYEKEKYLKGAEFIKTKSLRLLLPYVVFSILWVIPVGCYFYNYSTSDIIHKFLLGESPQQLWFLLMLFWVFILAYYLLKKDALIRNGIIVLLILAIGCLLGIFIPDILQILTSTKFLIYFYIGFSIRERFKALSNQTMLLIGLGMAILNVTFFVANMSSDCLGEGYAGLIMKMIFDLLTKIFGAIMAFMLLNLLARIINNTCFAIQYLYKYSFPIYLLHQQVIFIIIYNLVGIVPSSLLVLVNFAVSVIVSCLITNLLLRNKYSRLLLGL